jgi:cytochrome c553
MSARFATLLLAAACLAPSSFAGEVAAGRQKAAACAVCHGPLGMAVAPDAPNLAGQSAIYLSAQLKAYRDGTRKHEVMSLMAKPLSDADIDNLATWYASLKVQVQPPP